MWIDDINGTKVSAESLPNYLMNHVSKEDLLHLLETNLTKKELMKVAYQECESRGVNFLAELAFIKEV